MDSNRRSRRPSRLDASDSRPKAPIGALQRGSGSGQKSQPPWKSALKQLALKSPPGVRNEVLIDAVGLFEGLGRHIGKATAAGTIGVAEARRVASAVARWIQRLEVGGKAQQARITVGTVDAVGKLLLTLDEAGYRSLRGGVARKKSRRNPEGYRALIVAITTTLVAAARRADRCEAWGRILAAVGRLQADETEDVLSASVLGTESFAELAKGVTSALDESLLREDLELAQGVAEAARAHQELQAEVRRTLEDFGQVRLSELPAVSREWILVQRGHRVPERVAFARTSDRHGLRQAGGLLLFLWEVRETTPQLREAYERYRRIAEEELKLFLREENAAGRAVPFNPRVHEIDQAGDEEGQTVGVVVVLRPWVEHFDPPATRVVIRALVRLVTSSS